MELTVNDFPIGQKVGAIWRCVNDIEEVTFRFAVGKVSSVSITKNGTKIKCASIFRKPIEIDEFEDYRNFKKDELIFIDTPLLLSDESIEHFNEIVESWNKNGAKGIFD